MRERRLQQRKDPLNGPAKLLWESNQGSNDTELYGPLIGQ